MSQRNVERVIGRLITDEAFRGCFAVDPVGTLASLAESGMDLTPCELGALAALDPGLLARVADAIDPRLQKSDLGRGLA